MLSAYKLNEAIAGAVSGMQSDVTAHEFLGTLDEATADFAYEMMLEAAAYNETYTGAEELLIESAMTGASTFDALSEASLKGLKEGAINFFGKIISMVKGIIEKIKAYIARRLGKTDRWVSLMRSKIESGISNASGEVMAEMHNWDESYINSTMVTGLGTLKAKWKEKLKLKDTESRAKRWNDKPAGENSDRDTYRENRVTASKEGRDEFNKQGLIDELASALKVEQTSSLEAVFAAMTKKATGGEKTQVNIVPKAKAMLDAIADASKSISEVKRSYEALLKDLIEHQNKLKSYEIKNEHGDDADKKEVSSNESMIATILKADQAYTKNYIGAINQVRNYNNKFIDQMNMEYMKALTKISGVKAAKAEPEPEEKGAKKKK